MYEPVIKWSRSKRSQAEEILKYFPKEIDNYYEPFCGGCSVLRRLLDSNIKAKNYICSDLNKDLINLWNMIKDNPNQLIEDYEEYWNVFKNNKEYYYTIRKEFNEDKQPQKFLFLLRTCANGLSRFNSKGEFNSPVHNGRNGIKPETFKKICNAWSELLNENNVKFICQSYENIKTNKNDFMYLDPPYANTKGMYYGVLNYNIFWNWLRDQNCKYVLSFDGKTNKNEDKTYNVPNDIYSKHVYIKSGNSGFRRITGKSNDTIVYESLYIK